MLSRRLDKIGPYLFNEIDILKKSVKDAVDFGVGDPDIKTPDFIVESMINHLKDGKNHRYPPYEGMYELRKVISEYFFKRFNVNVNPENEIIILIGSKEGLAHSLQSILNDGDEVIIPSISYPVYRTQTEINGGLIKEFKVSYENKFVPDLDEIKKSLSKKSRAIFINYPNNPTGSTVDKNFYDDIVGFAKKNNLIIINDNVYSEVYFSKKKPPSILESDTYKEHSIEFHSFSKTFNMTGWRIGFAVGNKTLIEGLKKIKMNTDSGVFLPIQYAVMAALQNSEKHIEENNKIIKKRIDKLTDALYEKGFELHKPEATFYVFAKSRRGMKSMEFTKYLIEKAGIVTTPGIGFGSDGDGYVRFSATLSDENLERGIDKIKNLDI